MPPIAFRYARGVSASAEYFRNATRQAAAALSPEERVLRALALGQCDLEIYASVNGLTLDQARLDLRRRRDLERRNRSTGR